MNNNFVEYTLPVHWTSALINNDYSGLDSIEELELNNWIAEESKEYDMFYCVGVSEDSWFAWKNEANNLGGDVASFTFQIKE